MSIIARCSQCGRSLKAREADGGQSVECPVCRRNVWVAPSDAAVEPVGMTVSQAGDAGRRNLAAWCELVLLTIVVPWGVVNNALVWSWTILDQLPTQLATVVVVEWIMAVGLLILASCLHRLALSVVHTLVPLGCIALVASRAVAGVVALKSGGTWVGIAVPDLPALSMLTVLAGLSVVPLYISGYLRLRLGHGLVLSVIRGCCATVCGVLTWLVFRSTLAKHGLVAGTSLVAMALIISAAVLAVIHACSVGKRTLMWSLVSQKLILSTLTLVLLAAIVLPCVLRHNVDLGLPIAIAVVLIVAMPVLALTGVARLLADLADWAWPADLEAFAKQDAARRRRRAVRFESRLVLREGAKVLVCPLMPGKPLTIGRAAGNTIVLPDPTISSHHLRIKQRDGDWWVIDLGGVNGTLVNDCEVTEQPLMHGDIVDVGGREFQMEVVKARASRTFITGWKLALAVWLIVLALAAAAGMVWWLRRG